MFPNEQPGAQSQPAESRRLVGGQLEFRHDVTGRQEVEDALRQTNESLITLLEISQSLTRTLNLATVLQTVVDHAARLTGLDSGAIYLLKGESLYLGATTPPLPPEFPEIFRRAPLADHPHIGQALATGAVVFLPDTRTADLTPAEREISEARHLRSLLYLPLLIDQRAVGTLILGTGGETVRSFSEVEIDLYHILGSQAALAIENAHLYEESQRYAVELEQDVAERKRAEEALHSANASLETMIRVSPLAIFQVDLDDRVQIWNPAAESLFGWQAAEIYGKPNPIVPASRQDEYARLSTQVLDGTPMINYETVRQHKDGSWIDVSISSALIYDLAGNLTGRMAIVADITGRKQAEAEILRLNASLEQRVADRTRELEAANAQLRELDLLKSKFVSDVSHELRGPVNNLGLYLNLLEHGKAEKRAHYLEMLNAQTARLGRLIEDILDLSRLERQAGERAFAPVDLNDLIERIVIVYQPRAEAAGLRLICQLEPNLPPVSGETRQLEQVITNLVANAVNYTPAGQVQISTQHEGNEVCLRVADTGAGIDARDLPHLFERFYRGERARQSGVPGTGLGLGIVKEITERHGGTVVVESQVGHGSTFTVRLPAMA